MRHPLGNGSGTRWHDEQTFYSGSGTGHQTSKRHRWGIILAGGDGTRLQPLTQLTCGDDRPKQFCPLLGGKTLLTHTRQRVSRIIDTDRMLVVLTKKHEQFYQQELQCAPTIQKIVQPRNRGTLPAILWSLLRLYRTDEQAIAAFFPSDHFIANEDAFISTIDRSFDFVSKKRDSVVLLGAGAEYPETEYGWIEPECASASQFRSNLVPVRCFWEKPPLETAKQLLRRGCLWNTFVMIGSVGAFLEMIRRATPVLFKTFNGAVPGSDMETEEQTMRLVYERLEVADFSGKVLARSTERLLVASCGEVGWSDLGEPRRFIAALAERCAENPLAAPDVCNKCGLTREQIVTLTSQESTGTSRREPVCS